MCEVSARGCEINQGINQGGSACMGPCGPQIPNACPPVSKNHGSGCCGRAECCQVKTKCYIQPPRPKSFKPEHQYVRKECPQGLDSVYRKSYFCFDACTAKTARGAPIKHEDNLKTGKERMESCTVQKLSYQPNCPIERVAPIKPPPSTLMKGGMVQTVTTQKHDYVPKPTCVRQPIYQANNIGRPAAPLDGCTVNRLSYMPVDVVAFPPRQPIRPDRGRDTNLGPAESCTVYKLSYLPNCLPPKEDLPWARKQRHEPPPYTDLGTVYRYSYQKNCDIPKSYPIRHLSNFKLIGDGCPENNTVYKLSYMDAKGDRPVPIRPVDAMEKPCGAMENCTVYKLSYLPNECPIRTMPIKPFTSTRIDRSIPVQTVTTHKHDFVPKPICRTAPIRQAGNIGRSTGPMERYTVHRLSYLPNPCATPAKPIRPVQNNTMGTGPAECYTTYKLSYMPTCIPPKEHLPWAVKAVYQRPTQPMETCTVQKLSYMPPGRCVDQCCCSCMCNKDSNLMNSFPKAEITVC